MGKLHLITEEILYVLRTALETAKIRVGIHNLLKYIMTAFVNVEHHILNPSPITPLLGLCVHYLHKPRQSGS